VSASNFFAGGDTDGINFPTITQTVASGHFAASPERGTPPPPPENDNVQLGLFVTQDELNVWNLRARGLDPDGYNFNGTNPPWTNAPDDWARIVSRKNTLTGGSYVPWPGITYDWNGGNNPIQWDSSWVIDGGGGRPNTLPPQKNEQGAPEPIKHAAAYAMILGSYYLDPADQTINTTERDSVLQDVKDALLTIRNSQYNDFTNTSRYDPNNHYGNSFRPGDNLMHYLSQLVTAYDYSQIADPLFWSSTEKKDFINWLWSVEPWAGITGSDALVHRRRDGVVDVNTGAGIGSAYDPSTVDGVGIWNGSGAELYVHHEVDNHVPSFTAYFTCVAVLAEIEEARSGITFNDAGDYTLNPTNIEKGKEMGRWMAKHYLQNEVCANVPGNSAGNGTGGRMGSGNFYRGLLQNSAQGWKYSMEWLSGVLIGVDALARSGEEIPYGYSYTSGGGGYSGGLDTSGSIPDDNYFGNPGPKTLHRATQQMFRYIIEFGPPSYPWRFADETSTSTSLRIDSIAGDSSDVHSKEFEILPFLLRWNDQKLQDIYTRMAAGAPDHPSNPTSPHWDVEDGPQGMWAGACLQSALLENKVNPYGAQPIVPIPNLENPRLGLFVTQDELEIWNQRANASSGEGPRFHTKGEEYPNSPNDWTRVVNWKNDFLDHPTWFANWNPDNGYPNTPFDNSNTSNRPPQAEHRKTAENLDGPGRAYAAAFFAMVQGSVHLSPSQRQISASVRDGIIQDIEAGLISYTNNQYLDTSVMPRWTDTGQDQVGGYRLCFWLAQIIQAYDWCQVANPDAMSTASKEQIVAWFNSFIDFFMGDGNIGRVEEKPSDMDFDTGIAGTDLDNPRGKDPALIWLGGDEELEIHHKWDNHFPPNAAVITLAALEDELEDARDPNYTLQTTASERFTVYRVMECFTKHWLINECIANHNGNSGGTGSGGRMAAGQFYRGWTDNAPNDGWKYSCQHLGRVLVGGDAMARAGKTFDIPNLGGAQGTCYDLEYTIGVGGGTGVNTSGSVPDDTYFQNPGPKTYHRAVQQHTRYVIETGSDSYPWRFSGAKDNIPSATPDDRIDSTASGQGGYDRSNEWELLPFNMRWADPRITDIMDRSASGTPDHDANPRGGSYAVEQGPMGMFFPNFMFMYVAGTVDPYHGAVAPPPPTLNTVGKSVTMRWDIQEQTAGELLYGVDPALVGPSQEPAETTGTQATTSNYTTVIGSANSGDVVLMRGGTYTSDLTVPAGVTVKPYNQESLLITGQWTIGGDNVTIAGLTWDVGNGKQRCIIASQNSSNALENLEIRYCAFKGGTTNNIRLDYNIQNARIHHNTLESAYCNHLIHTHYKDSPTYGPGNIEIDHNIFGDCFLEDQIQIHGSTGDHDIHHNNFVGNVGEESIDIKQAKGPYTFYFRNNYININSGKNRFCKFQAGFEATVVCHNNWVTGTGPTIGTDHSYDHTVDFQWNIVDGIASGHPGNMNFRLTKNSICSHNLLIGENANGQWSSGNASDEPNVNVLVADNRIEGFTTWQADASWSTAAGSTNNEFVNTNSTIFTSRGIQGGTSSGYPTIPSSTPYG